MTDDTPCMGTREISSIQDGNHEVQRLAAELERSRQALAEATRALERQRSALTASESRFRLLAENVSDTLWIMDLETLKFDYISPSVARNRGFTAAEAVAMSLEQTLSPMSLAEVRRLLEAELATDGRPGVDPQRSRRVEIEQSIKGGGYAWAETTITFIRDPKGAPTALMGVTRDISERKAIERRVAESEKKYRNLFENGSDLICIHDLDGRLLETNIHFKTEYGWRREDLDGANIRELIPPGRRPEFDAYLERVLATGADDGYLKVLTRSGREVLLEYRNRLILDDEGRPRAVQGAARDVTERIHYEKALRESEEKYKNLVRHAPAGIYEFDMQTLKFVSVNDVMCQYSGYTRSELLELDPFAILAEESKGMLTSLVAEVFTTRPSQLTTEYKLAGKHGREFWVLSNARFFYENGIPTRAMAVIHDLTAIRKAEEEKRALEIKLQNARKLESLGTLAGGVAHDLNNILSGIVSYPDFLLLDIEEGHPLRQPLLAIKRSGEKAAEIVQDLLTLARRSTAAKKVINLTHIVNEFLASPEYRKIVDDRNDLAVTADLAGDMLNVMGSGTHISKTIMNLVANAADAMPAGGRVTVSTRDCYVDKPLVGFEVIPEGEYCILEIADTGIGIPRADLEKIFEPFYTKKVMGRSGTGLGMSVVWGTVKDHDGFIDIVTAEGSGTTFSLYFPASRSDKETPASVYIDDYLGKGESVLIIDDAPEQRDLAGRMLQRLGYDVHAAASGEEAVALIHEKRFAVLILDMIMPGGMNGLETFRAILEIVPGQKAVIASGYAESAQVHEAQRLGAGRYIKKPYTLEKIGLAVRSELDRP